MNVFGKTIKDKLMEKHVLKYYEINGDF